MPTEPEPPPRPARPTAVPPPRDVEGDAGGSPVPREHTRDERFRRTEEGLDWRCDVCQQWNPIEVTSCTVCGSAFGRSLSPASDANHEVPETTVMVASSAAPGLGHILLGKRIAGWSRLVTWGLWFVGGLWLLLEARSVGGSVLPAIPLLLGAVIIWVSSPIDALTARRGSSDEILRPRVFLWLVVAVLGTLMLAFLAAATALGGLG